MALNYRDLPAKLRAQVDAQVATEKSGAARESGRREPRGGRDVHSPANPGAAAPDQSAWTCRGPRGCGHVSTSYAAAERHSAEQGHHRIEMSAHDERTDDGMGD